MTMRNTVYSCIIIYCKPTFAPPCIRRSRRQEKSGGDVLEGLVVNVVKGLIQVGTFDTDLKE